MPPTEYFTGVPWACQCLLQHLRFGSFLVLLMGNGHVVLKNHLLDNGSTLSSDRLGELTLNCLCGLMVAYCGEQCTAAFAASA